MADVAKAESTDEIPADVLRAYEFYGAMIEKGVDQAAARKVTCQRFPRCEDRLRPLWEMDDQLRCASPKPRAGEPTIVVEQASAAPSPQGFTAICRIGEGGQAEVWLARDQKLDRYVALKVIKRSLRDSLRTQQRFRREVEITGKLEHPSIVPVYETGDSTAADGAEHECLYYVMRLFINRHLLRAIIAFHDRERQSTDQRMLAALFAFHRSRSAASRQELEAALQTLDYESKLPCDFELKDAVERLLADSRTGSGGNLHEAIEAHFAAGRPALGFRDLLGRFIDVCHAMAYAHSRGVIHRDLKPRNVMLGEFGETLVVDWGLAKIVGRGGETHPIDSGGTVILSPDDSTDDSETRVGTVTGTVQYMSPEQAWGRVSELRPAADIFSLGAILFTILTGKPPRQDMSLAAAREGKVDEPSAVQTQVPRALEKVCLKALAKDPADRYASAEELANDVRNWLSDEPVSIWREPLHTRARRWVKKHRALVGSFAAALLVAAATLLLTVPKLLATSEKLVLTQKTVERLVQDQGSRANELAQAKEQARRVALVNDINAHGGRGDRVFEQGDAESALAEYESGLKVALEAWGTNPGDPDLGHSVMQLYHRKARACESLQYYDAAIECFRSEVEVCLSVLSGRSSPALPAATSAGGEPDLFTTLSQVRQELQVVPLLLHHADGIVPVATDGVDSVDALLLGLLTASGTAQHFESLLIVAAADDRDRNSDAWHLADLYRQLGKVELRDGRVAQAHQSFVRYLSVSAFLSEDYFRSPGNEALGTESALPPKNDPAITPPMDDPAASND